MGRPSFRLVINCAMSLKKDGDLRIFLSKLRFDRNSFVAGNHLAVSPSTFSWSIREGNPCRMLLFLAIFPAGVASGPKKSRLCFRMSRAGSFPLT